MVGIQTHFHQISSYKAAKHQTSSSQMTKESDIQAADSIHHTRERELKDDDSPEQQIDTPPGADMQRTCVLWFKSLKAESWSWK